MCKMGEASSKPSDKQRKSDPGEGMKVAQDQVTRYTRIVSRLVFVGVCLVQGKSSLIDEDSWSLQQLESKRSRIPFAIFKEYDGDGNTLGADNEMTLMPYDLMVELRGNL